MQSLIVYSSTPLSTQLACVFQGLSRQGFAVVVRPISQLPAVARPHPQRAQLGREREQLCQRLVEIGARLEQFETGQCVPLVGEEQGLRFERDALLSRVQGIKQTLNRPWGRAPS